MTVNSSVSSLFPILMKQSAFKAMKANVKSLLMRAKIAADPSGVMSDAERKNLLEDIQSLIDGEDKTPWWVIALKVLAYAIGLILAGFGTTAAAATVIHLM